MSKLILILFLLNTGVIYSQEIIRPGKTIEKNLLKDEKHPYSVELNYGECANLVVFQKEVNVAIDVVNPTGKTIKKIDDFSNKLDSETVFIEATETGKYNIYIYPAFFEWSDQIKTAWKEGNPDKNLDSLIVVLKKENQGSYEINNVSILTPEQCQKKLIDEKIALQKKREEDSITNLKIMD